MTEYKANHLGNLLAIKKQIEEGKSIFEIPLRICFYARVSTDKDGQINSLSNQISYFEELINSNANWTYAGGYIDEGISGKNVEKRAQFLKMIGDARAGEFDLIITKEISRFSRNTLDSIKYTQELLSYGVGVFFQSDNINTLQPDSELRLTIMASIAQEEVRKLSERLRFGYKRAIEKGRVLGQNNLYGYNKKDGKLTIVPHEAKIIRKIYNMYIEGNMGVRRIAQELEKSGIVSPNTGKIFGSDTIKNIIQNPKYKGYYCSGKTMSIDYKQNKRIKVNDSAWTIHKDDNIPPIVSEEIWEAANNLYKKRSSFYKENSGKYLQRYPLSGKLICAEHGTSYHRHVYKSKKRGDQEVWNCKLYRQRGKQAGCNSPTIYTSELQPILNEIYAAMHNSQDDVISGLVRIYSQIDKHDYAAEAAALQEVIHNIHKKKDKLLELHMYDAISIAEFKERNNNLSAEIERHTHALKELHAEEKLQSQNAADINELRKMLSQEFAANDNFNAELNHSLLDKILVHKINNDNSHLQLEIQLRIGNTHHARLVTRPHKSTTSTIQMHDASQNAVANNCISLEQIGISQAQVSRLEKNALKNMKKYIS